MEGTEGSPARGELSAIEQKLIEGQVLEALRTCYDPEIPVNIYEMGLVYDVRVALDGGVLVTMTLTSPSCPAAQSLPREVEAKVRAITGVTAVKVNVVWDPQWNPSMMSEAARLELGF
ncbi:MAG TPA: iron-sulfur cluster assembly protein [Bacteroidota bacterium]|nr:iron-sulfur cluster assembly protein [Bacteroidota bacterium]